VLRIYKYSLLPVLVAQALRLRRTALRLPEPAGPRDGIVGDAARAVRVLFVGDSSAAGVGVDHQLDALALPTASALAARLRATVHWQLVAKSGLNTLQALKLLRHAAVRRADLLVTALGTNDVTSQQSPRRFLSAYQALVEHAAVQLGVRAAVVTGLPPLHILPVAPQPLRWYLGQYAKRLDALLERWCAATDNLSYLSLAWAAKPAHLAADGFHPGAGQYRHWSGLVGDRLAELVHRLRVAPG
jgi:lysophospholipase L1-like esterase